MASFFSNLFGRSEQAAPRETVTVNENIYPADSFAFLNAEGNGVAIMGSVNKAYKTYSRKADFPWCLHIGISLQADQVQPNGLPKSDESDIAYKQEDELLDEIKKLGPAHFVGHIFNDSFLDLYVYLQEPEAAHKFLQTQINKPDLHRGFGYEINEDKEWSRVEALLQ